MGDDEIVIEILYAGICHSDLHQARSEWKKEIYPMVPGHEIAGRVVKVGKNVKKFKVGDYAGVGCMVNSCKQCSDCQKNHEQYCKKRVLTYAQKDPFHKNEVTMGGYSNNIVLSEDFAIKVPKNADITKVAPLLCAGITTYSPIKYAKIKKGDEVAVAGFGGLGHMAVQYLVKQEAEITVIDRTEEKRADALRLGAQKYININNEKDLENTANTYKFILSTIPTNYNPAFYIQMLKEDGEMAIVGMPANDSAPMLDIRQLVKNAHRKVYDSVIGGIAETQEMLDYSVKNNIYPEVKIISGTEIDKAYEDVSAGNVKFRYVIDMSTLK